MLQKILFLFTLFYTVYAIDVPFVDCGSYLAHIEKIEANTWTPKFGQDLTLTSHGYSKFNITHGTFKVATYFMGFIINDVKGDLCSLITCPLNSGNFEITSSSIFPNDAPNGNYRSQMVTHNQNEELLYCTEIAFDI